MKINFKHTLLIFSVLFPYFFSTILLLSMTTRKAVFEWVANNIPSIVSMITLGMIVAFRIDFFKKTKMYQERTNVIEKKLGSIQKDTNTANRQISILQNRTAKNEGEISILKSIIIK